MDRTVAELMTRDVQVLHEEDDLTEVGLRMDVFGLRHLPVVDDGQRLVGLVTHRDLLRWSTSRLDAFAADRDARLKSGHFVAAVMNRDVTTTRADTPLAAAARTLLDTKFGCLPVIDDDGRLVGILSEQDLLRLLVELLEEKTS